MDADADANHLHTRKLRTRWKEFLPEPMATELYDTGRLIVFDGDILQPNMGLSASELDVLRNNVQVVIHAASTIHLGRSLRDLIKPIIEASQMIADLVLSFPKFDRFVYVSTAFANSYLCPRNPGTGATIEEEIYSLRIESNVTDELEEVQKSGTSKAYRSENFPWGYAYGKHITERFLLHKFSERGIQEKLLILRPSVIGPAQCYPFPFYTMAMSSPFVVGAALTALYPFRYLKIATQLDTPESEIQVNEVPVDVVVDRLLAHLSMGTSGCVHATGMQRMFQMGLDIQLEIRRLPWQIYPVWVNDDWKSDKQTWPFRIYAVLGTSMTFLDGKTVALSRRLSDGEKGDLQLFSTHTSFNLVGRAKAIRYAMDYFAARSWVAWLLVWLLYSDYGKDSTTQGVKVKSS